jgi:hypothetical protein
MTEQRPLAELHAASDRLWHEYWMLRCVARAAADEAATMYALEESFALHLRNLHRFLYASGGSAGKDDIRAEDFLGAEWRANRPEPSTLLLEAVAWAELRLSPLAYEVTAAGVPRGSGPGGSGFSRDHPRTWTLLEASFELQKVMDPFVSSTPRNLLGPRWKIAYEGVVV